MNRSQPGPAVPDRPPPAPSPARGRGRGRDALAAALGLLLATMCLGASSCGGSKAKTPAKAAITSTSSSAQATTTSSTPTPSSEESASGQPTSKPVFRSALDHFVACLRSHGATVPEPNRSGKGPLFDLKGIDTRSPTFAAALGACRNLVSDVVGGELRR